MSAAANPTPTRALADDHALAPLTPAEAAKVAAILMAGSSTRTSTSTRGGAS